MQDNGKYRCRQVQTVMPMNTFKDILKRIPEPLPNGRSKRMFNIPETESVAIESKLDDWKTFQN